MLRDHVTSKFHLRPPRESRPLGQLTEVEKGWCVGPAAFGVCGASLNAESPTRLEALRSGGAGHPEDQAGLWRDQCGGHSRQERRQHRIPEVLGSPAAGLTPQSTGLVAGSSHPWQLGAGVDVPTR